MDKANLILKYKKGNLSPEELKQLREWVDEDIANQKLLADLEDERKLAEGIQFLALIDKKAAWERINEKINEPVLVGRVIPIWRYWKMAAAAMLILCLGYTLYTNTYIDNRLKEKPTAKAVLPNDVLPGGNKATLALADGSVWDLEAIKNGTFREENGIRVSKKDGQLNYEVIKTDIDRPMAYNIITTPVGGQYKLVLQDGSQVWLNAASSIRFPMAFSGQSRQVDLTGEGYFEIARNEQMPFMVKAKGTSVEVLGTHFNVMAYANENLVKATLLEGSVKVNNGLFSKQITPGQQALANETIQIRNVDTTEAVAWKNGYFQFENEDLKVILRQLKRWYHIEIDNEQHIPDKHFTAVISRNTSLSQVLKMLEMSGELHFAIRNNKVTIKENK